MSDFVILSVVLGAFLLVPASIGVAVNGLHLGTRAGIGRRVIRQANRTSDQPALSRAGATARVVLTLVSVLGALAALACLVR